MGSPMLLTLPPIKRRPSFYSLTTVFIIQCDQIGRFINWISEISWWQISLQKFPEYLDTFWALLKKCNFLIKTCCASFGDFSLFLFQHLVTLMAALKTDDQSSNLPYWLSKLVSIESLIWPLPYPVGLSESVLKYILAP